MDRTGNKYRPITESVHYLPAKAFPCLQNRGGQEIAPSLAGLELTNYGILARQGAPAIPVSQPPPTLELHAHSTIFYEKARNEVRALAYKVSALLTPFPRPCILKFLKLRYPNGKFTELRD